VTPAPQLRHDLGILDTSAVIVLDDVAPKHFPIKALISTVTLAELSVGPLVARSDRARHRRQEHLQLAEADFEPLPFDAAAARAFGRVSASLRRAGRKAHSRTYDAMIAAIAIAEGLPLYTCNPGDFECIEGLEVVAVPQPTRAGLT
jgi:tRNA(fMet)-specific endonuclease VapC